MATPHNRAANGEIAKTVLMPGDPLRAKWIAETYLADVQLVSDVRNVFCYTGQYKGVTVSVMASGMGMPSIGIYSYELYKFYDVKNIIRVGTAGAYTKDLNLYDVVLVIASYSDSSYAKVQNNSDDKLIEASYATNLYISTTAEERNIPITIGNIYSSDVFYKEEDNYKDIVKEIGCIACEMESFALFHNAKVFNKRASCLLTISNSFVTNEETTAEERQNAFTKMIELALEASLKM